MVPFRCFGCGLRWTLSSEDAKTIFCCPSCGMPVSPKADSDSYRDDGVPLPRRRKHRHRSLFGVRIVERRDLPEPYRTGPMTLDDMGTMYKNGAKFGVKLFLGAYLWLFLLTLLSLPFWVGYGCYLNHQKQRDADARQLRSQQVHRLP